MKQVEVKVFRPGAIRPVWMTEAEARTIPGIRPYRVYVPGLYAAFPEPGGYIIVWAETPDDAMIGCGGDSSADELE